MKPPARVEGALDKSGGGIKQWKSRDVKGGVVGNLQFYSEK